MTKEKIINLLIWLVILVVIIFAFYFQSILPETVITHWNAAGEADGWGSKKVNTIFIPALMVGMYLLFWALPKIDPHKANYQKFGFAYKIIQLVLIGFFGIIFFITNLVNLGYKIPIDISMSVIIGLMFVILGLYLKNVKRNWFVGIRTPWTLSSDIVWEKTHQFGSGMFVLSGILFVITGLLPANWFLYIFILAMLPIFSTIIYSYYIHKNLDNIEKK